MVIGSQLLSQWATEILDRMLFSNFTRFVQLILLLNQKAEELMVSVERLLLSDGTGSFLAEAAYEYLIR